VKENKSDTAAYSEWKGWGTQVEFGRLTSGDAQYYTKELREVLRSNSPIRDVLEVGFGNGLFLAFGRSLGWTVTGTELSPELVEEAKSAGYSAHDAGFLSKLPDNSFDLICAFDVFEHVPESESVEFLQAIAAKLRPGGFIVLRFPNADSPLGNPFQYGDPTHVNAIGSLKLAYYAARAHLIVTAFRASSRRSFRTSFVHGVNATVVGPLLDFGAFLRRLVYFPGLRVVLSASNVVCVLRPGDRTS
jgi:2-polyprenyl-3-methyl-5-hydroxy-6-metoxy-1,4-benzoquinol methylase